MHWCNILFIICFIFTFIFFLTPQIFLLRLNARKRSQKKSCSPSRVPATEQRTWWWVRVNILILSRFFSLFLSISLFFHSRWSVRKHNPKRWCTLRTQLVRGRQCSGDSTGCMVSPRCQFVSNGTWVQLYPAFQLIYIYPGRWTESFIYDLIPPDCCH